MRTHIHALVLETLAHRVNVRLPAKEIEILDLEAAGDLYPLRADLRQKLAKSHHPCTSKVFSSRPFSTCGRVDDVLVSDHLVILASQLAQVLGLTGVVALVPV